MCFWVGAEDVAGVVGDVEPLVPVDRPRVGLVEAGCERPCRWACCGPDPEGAVDMSPGAMAVRQLARVREVIAGAGVHVTRL